MSRARALTYATGMVVVLAVMWWLVPAPNAPLSPEARELQQLGNRVDEIQAEYGSAEAALAAGQGRYRTWLEEVEGERRERRVRIALGHEDPRVRWVAWAAWSTPSSLGLDELDQLLAASEDPDPRVREVALRHLGNVRVVTGAARRRLLGLLSAMASPELQAAAARILAHQDGVAQELLASAIAFLEAGPPRDAAMAYALSRTEIEPALEGWSDETRRELASHLVLLTLPGRHQGERIAAMHALARFAAYEGVIDALMEALRDPDIAIRGSATNALSDLGEAVIPRVGGLLEAESSVRTEGLESRLVWILERMNTPASRAQLERLAAGGSPTVALRCRLALNPRGPARVGVLGEALRGPTGAATLLALEQATRMGPAAAGLAPTIRLLTEAGAADVRDKAHAALEAVEAE